MDKLIYGKLLSNAVVGFLIAMIILAFNEDVTLSISSGVYVFFLWFFLEKMVALFIVGKSYYGLGRQLVELKTNDRINYLSIGLLLGTYIPICVVITLWLVSYKW